LVDENEYADSISSLGMAEMTTLLAAIYRKYTTNGHKRQNEASPGITSRFEVFYDETFPEVKVSASTLQGPEVPSLNVSNNRNINAGSTLRREKNELIY
jgi:hypothetical protein